MSRDAFWSNACLYALGRPLQTQLHAANASCGATVSDGALLMLVVVVLLLQLLVLAVFALHCGLSVFLSRCNALLCRLRRFVCALWRAGGCCICGGGWRRRDGGACGRCTDGFAG